LNPDGSEDSELKIKDLPGIVVGDYNRPAIISDDDDEMGDTIEVQELEQEEDQGDMMTDSGDDTDVRFDYDSGSDFDDEIDNDEQEGGCVMD
jgi:hypothetical protein